MDVGASKELNDLLDFSAVRIDGFFILYADNLI